MKKNFFILFLFFFLAAGFLRADELLDSRNRILDYSARIKKENISLYWKIQDPYDVKSITIDYRKAGSDEYKRMGILSFDSFDKKELRDSLDTYSYTLKSKLEENGVYFIRITIIGNNNNEITSNEMKIGVSGISEFTLKQNTPNPFNPVTSISYQLYTAGKVSLRVYNMTGKTVAVLVDGYQTPGNYSYEFNAGEYGELSSGIYFYKLQTDYSSDIKKMILTK